MPQAEVYREYILTKPKYTPITEFNTSGKLWLRKPGPFHVVVFPVVWNGLAVRLTFKDYYAFLMDNKVIRRKRSQNIAVHFITARNPRISLVEKGDFMGDISVYL